MISPPLPDASLLLLSDFLESNSYNTHENT